MVTAAVKLKTKQNKTKPCSLGKKLWQTLDMVSKVRTSLCRHSSIHSQGYGLSSGHVRLWELDHKEGRAPKNWCLQTVVLEKTLESPLDSKEIKPVNLKGNLPWKLTGRTDAEAEAPGFWSPDTNSRLTGKIPDAGKDWGQKEEKASEDEVAGWHHWCNGHELRQTSGDGEEQGGLVCYRVSGGCKESVIKQKQQHIEPKTSEHHFQILLLLYTYQEKKKYWFLHLSVSAGSAWNKPSFPILPHPLSISIYGHILNSTLSQTICACALLSPLLYNYDHCNSQKQ